MISIDPSVFEPEAVLDETRALNQRIIAELEAGPDPWSLDPEVIRQARREGKGIFPNEPKLKDARNFTVQNGDVAVPIREVKPSSGTIRGAFLHIHGGGWRLGAFDQQDQRLKRLADSTGMVCLSVEYRLSPEYPYPSGPDDCEAAALWLCENASKEYGTSFLAIGGESAGAHLSVATLLRLRDKHQINQFSAAILIAGCFDMRGSPSAVRFGNERLILTTRDIENFADSFLQKREDRTSPDISPIFAELDGMPPAIFSVGTRDALLDDSLTMASRWIQEQNDVELEIAPGGCHMFQFYPELTIAQESLNRIETFANRQIDKAG